MSTERFDFANLELLGGAPCLDLINTFDWRGREDRTDYLTDFADLLAWSAHAGLLKENRRAALAGLAKDHPDRAERVFKLACELREAAHRLLTGSVTDQDLDLVNGQLDDLAQPRLALIGRGFKLARPLLPPRLEELLEPVLASLTELLTSPQRRFIKTCADEDCGWLFLDLSRNHSRRWCDMADCGNRSKAARFYSRKKSRRI